MKKSLLLVVVALFAVSAHAQDVNRSVGVYFDAYSGDIVNGNIASGSCFEFGVGYSQNFSSAQWLTLSVSALTAVAQRTTLTADEDAKWVGNGSTDTYTTANARAKLGLNFAGYASVSADTRSLVYIGGGHGHDLGSAGSVYYGADVCFFAVPTVADAAYSEDAGWLVDGNNVETKSLDLFQAYVGYSVPFASAWGFNTKLMFRFNDEEAFAESFRIRWDNTVSYSVDGLGFWGKVRYQVDNLANDADLVNSVYLQAGVSYSFDFSNN